MTCPASSTHPIRTHIVRLQSLGLLAFATVALCACSSSGQLVNNALAPDNGGGEPPRGGINFDYGVNVDSKSVDVGLLYISRSQEDEEGPDDCRTGRQLLESDLERQAGTLLPPGWSLRSLPIATNGAEASPQTAYDQLKDRSLFLLSCLSPKQEAVLRPQLPRNDLVLFSGNRDRAAFEHEFTPPVGASLSTEVRRAIEWASEQSEGNPGPGLMTADGTVGEEVQQVAEATATTLGRPLSFSHRLGNGEDAIRQAVSQVKKSGSEFVVLAGSSEQSRQVIEAAHKGKVRPKWVVLSHSWSERLEGKDAMEASDLESVFRVTGWPLPGPEAPGYPTLAARWSEIHGSAPLPAEAAGFYAQGRIAARALQRAIQNQDVTRSGFRRALAEERASRGGELLYPQNYQQIPYPGSIRVPIVQIVPGEAPKWMSAAEEPRTGGRTTEAPDNSADEMPTKANEDGAAPKEIPSPD